MRLHRRIAETLEQAHDASEHAAEIAYHYHRSSTLPGSEKGVTYAISAADHAEAVYAHDDAVAFLRMALDLLPDLDPQRPRLLARFGLALVWNLEFTEACQVATDAANFIAQTKGRNAAADYLADAVTALGDAGSMRETWTLAELGLQFVEDRRDVTWALLKNWDLLRLAASDPDNPGLLLDTTESREVDAILQDRYVGTTTWIPIHFQSLNEVLERDPDSVFVRAYYAGGYRRGVALFEQEAVRAEREGRLAQAAGHWGHVARLNATLGRFQEADRVYEHGMSLAARLPGPSGWTAALLGARTEIRAARGQIAEGLDEVESLLRLPALEDQWMFAAIRAGGAAIYAWVGRDEDAVRWLQTLPVAIERAPLWAHNYALLIGFTAFALWHLGRAEHADIVERNLRQKVIEPDMHYPGVDGRHSLALVCALQGRCDEAVEWFQKARQVLDEQGARPLRAIIDFDEAWMYLRRGQPGDHQRAAPLLDRLGQPDRGAVCKHRRLKVLLFRSRPYRHNADISHLGYHGRAGMHSKHRNNWTRFK